MSNSRFEYFKEYQKEYYQRQEVVERRKENAKAYYQRADVIKKRREDYKDVRTQSRKKRRENDPSFRFMDSLRNRQKQVLKGITSTTKGLGCAKDELRDYLIAQFLEGMSFDNYGNKKDSWSIDHIIPLSSYEKDENGNWDINSEYNKKLIHYTNLQPMWHIENVKKNNTISVP